MPPLAASPALDTLQHQPPETWLKLGIALAVLAIAFVVLRRLARMSKLLLALAVAVAAAAVLFSWVYLRNEPRVLTPLIDRLAPCFPGAGPPAARPPAAPRR